ncbi:MULTISPECIES: nucleotidyltransferase domain-containing protein [Gammaproteobacteria]|uniref:nucleotidyltransferase domain-containing protein n=1 Tax=Gammaproteobacteria TaxID=1236 RepID=UPI0004E34851|nr:MULTISPECIES: nucleotidyltransferase [Gammaproteobacteria]EGQ8013970.1 nucleotidyltransferase [Vibrio cholerae]EGQ9854202.1 nucleotidyltransferase [Vibrio cholerae]EGR0581194.1 nucleotidyltransferase [Vibrio cholerae]EGR3958613.1 nucleotidyltransferase [Vibrio cholerae]ELH0899629.1 nucleotidyltransferase [Vibrio cholerae]
MSLQNQFSKFHDKIKLGREDDSYREARTKDSSILDDLRDEFKNAGYPIIETFIQGSFSTHTGIKHPVADFDIDRAVVIDADNAPNDPVEVKKLVLKVLEKRGFKNARIKKPCVTADYINLNLHIDIVIYRKRGQQYELAVGKLNSNVENREWSPAEPKKLIEHINDSSQYIGSADLKNRQVKRLVRYVKRWRDEKFGQNVGKKVFSIGLTLMLKDKFRPSISYDGKVNDLQSLRDTISAILNANYFQSVDYSKYKVNVQLPVQPYRNVFENSSIDTGTQLYNKLNAMLTKLDQALNEDSLSKQCEILQGLFGDDFEVPEKEQDSNAKKVAYSSAGVVGTSQGA